MRLIDADTLLKKKMRVINGYDEPYNFDAVAECHIIDAPTIDAVEVVRCKECKYLGVKDFITGCCKHRVCGIVYPDDYCSLGEKDDE